MNIQERIIHQLEALDIEFEHFRHEAVTSVAIGKEIYAREGIQGIHVKNLFLRNKKGSQHYLVTVLADKEVDLKKLSDTLEDRKLGFASSERLQKHLGIAPGCVSPLALINDTQLHTKVVFDADIDSSEHIHIHPGINTASVVITVKDLVRFVECLGFEIFWTEIA